VKGWCIRTKSKRRRRNAKTLLVRYGATNVFSKGSLLFQKVQDKLAGKRPILKGEDNPFAWPEVQAKILITNLERYGVENPNQNLEVRKRTQITNLSRYGVLESLSAPEVRERIAATNKVKYGGPAPSNDPVVVEKARQTNLERWGVEWTTLRPELRRPGPNLLEARFGMLNPELVYTGNGGFWCWSPRLKRHKNPDFILPGLEPSNLKKGVTKVVEVFGDYWHSKTFTGKNHFDHELEIVSAYADIGIQCLVVWEDDVNSDPSSVRARVLEFLFCLSPIPASV
jgi:hypothetical protein